MNTKNIKYLFALLTALVVFNSCKKEYESIESIDDAKIQAYIQKNKIPAIKDPSGYYYQVLEQGTGSPLLNKDSVFYSLNIKSLTDAVYYTPTGYSNEGNYLGYLTPEPYRNALYTINRGGKVRVIIPSYLAYGKNGTGIIPPNEVLVSEISVLPETKQWEIDDKVIKKFIADKGLNLLKNSARVYFNISTVGNGSFITPNSTITAKYTGRLLTGTIFDQSIGDATLISSLKSLIPGWQKVLVGVTKGSKLRILIPSDLGYGTTGSTGIPPNSVLDFDIEIVDVTN